MRDQRYGIDFADLRVLRLVYEYRSFSIAAERLEMNQSAVSYGIDKLRKSFGDPLFVRQGGEALRADRPVRGAGDLRPVLIEVLQEEVQEHQRQQSAERQRHKLVHAAYAT